MTEQPPPTRSDRQPPWSFDAAELAELFAGGILSDEEQAEFDARLEAGDAQLLAQLERVQPVLEALLSAAPIEPPEHVRTEIQSQIAERSLPAAGKPAAASASNSGAVPAGVFVHTASKARWRRSGIPGVWVQQLFADRSADRITMLVKCDPGARIPDHDHHGIEEMIVLEGEVRVGDLLLKVGDYFRALAGSDHGEIHSPAGCVCLLFTGYGTLTAQTRLSMLVRGLLQPVRNLLGR